MLSRLTFLVVLSISVLSLGLTAAQGGEQSLAANSPDDAMSRFEELARRYKSRDESFQKQEPQEGEDWRQRFVSDHPMNSMVDEFLQLEQDARGTKVGFSCLWHLVSRARTTNDAKLPVCVGKVKALEVLAKYYADYPDVDSTFRAVFMGAWLPEAKTFLRNIIASSSHEYIRANAMYELANHLALEANSVPMLEARLTVMDKSDPNYDARVKFVKDFIDGLGDMDPAINRAEAGRLVRQLESEFPTELVPPYADGNTPVIIDINREPFDQILETKRESIADQLPAVLFEINHGLGEPAPEIDGNDALGKPMTLTAFRGNVVVVMFSYKGCGPCEVMYPENRELVEELADRPFAFLGIQADQTIDTVRETIDAGDITWRVWWDGKNKGISTRWNIRQWPSTFILDKNGVIRFRGLRGKELANAVQHLLAKSAG